jgi:hypothetical protein
MALSKDIRASQHYLQKASLCQLDKYEADLPTSLYNGIRDGRITTLYDNNDDDLNDDDFDCNDLVHVGREEEEEEEEEYEEEKKTRMSKKKAGKCRSNSNGARNCQEEEVKVKQTKYRNRRKPEIVEKHLKNVGKRPTNVIYINITSNTRYLLTFSLCAPLCFLTVLQ